MHIVQIHEKKAIISSGKNIEGKIKKLWKCEYQKMSMFKLMHV